MTRLDKRTLWTAVIVLLLIVAAVCCRALGRAGIFRIGTGIIRSFIYIGLFGAWGISLWRRIVQRQVRDYLLAVSALELFWIVLRTLKYYFVTDVAMNRLLWYMYYIPMQFIPMLAVFIAIFLGKSEQYSLPKWMLLLHIPTTLLTLLVLTNDLHQLVFTFPSGTTIWTDDSYSYNIGYWLTASWEILCFAAAIVIIILKCRVPQSRRVLWLPLAPFAVSLLYCACYVAGFPWLNVIAGDVTVTQCLLISALFESCIQCGLIQSNTGYDTLFRASSIRAQITDRNYRVRYASANTLDIPEPVLRRTEKSAVALDRATLLKGNPIRAGHVVWLEDVEELADALDELKENQSEIAHTNEVERENYSTKRRISQLREKNRLYDLLQAQTAKQNELLSAILDRYLHTEDESARRELLAKAAVLGAYVKRRGNLVFLRDQNDLLPVTELSLCLNESLQNLDLMGVAGELSLKLSGTMEVSSAIRIYDLFEAVVEASFEKLTGLWIHISERPNGVAAHIEAVCEAELSHLSESGAKVCHENDGTWNLTLLLPKGGALQ